MFRATRGLMAMLLLAAASQAFPHHSFAMFDTKKEVTLKGTVKEFMWTNPHAFLHIVVQKDGSQEEWQLEMASPNMLKRRGWNRTIVKPGDVVTVVFHPLRDGSRGGSFVYLTLEDGTLLHSGVKPQE